jgi:hypothetical protein
MNNEQQSPSSIQNINSNSLKCCGLGCLNLGKYKLKIRWVKKSGFFCKSCADNIKESGLVYEDGN